MLPLPHGHFVTQDVSEILYHHRLLLDVPSSEESQALYAHTRTLNSLFCSFTVFLLHMKKADVDLDARVGEVNIALPLAAQSPVLRRLGVNKVFTVGRAGLRRSRVLDR